MIEKPSYEELEIRLAALQAEHNRLKRLKTINTALHVIADAIITTTTLQELYRKIHLTLGTVIDTTNFYLALYEKDNDSITFPYIIDLVDVNYPPVINVSKTASLTAEVIRSQAPLLIRKEEILARQSRSSLSTPSCTPSEIWLGVPLRTAREVIGVMTVQSYSDPDCYDLTDLTTLVSVADMVALALERKRAEEALREKNLQLQQAMDQIKTLRGIVPICMHCKKIRDDQGYWSQVEVYVRNHTEAEFSHSLCPDCASDHYPDYIGSNGSKEDR